MSQDASYRLKKSIETIVSRWQERVRAEIPATHTQDKPALDNQLRVFLAQLSDALSTAHDRTEESKRVDREAIKKSSRNHGQSRAEFRNYSIDELILEYHILRQIVCDVLEEEAPLTAQEREIIVSAIEQAVNDAATQYSRAMREVKERFTATLAHDLRNPVAAVKLQAEILLRTNGVGAGSERAARFIVQKMNHVDSLIQDILDASRLSAGESLTPHFETGGLRSTLQQIVGEYEKSGTEKVRLHCDSELKGNWDRKAVRRIVENLVNNGLKYGSPDRPITVNVEENHRAVTITVHNEGNPISPEDQKEVFHQFKRIETGEFKPGWGLGLVVVKGLTEALGGTIVVESDRDRGTSFIVKLPKDSRRGKAEHVA